MNFYVLTIALLVGVAPFLIRRAPKIFNHFITVFHEVGHALTSLIFGGQVKSIRINADGSGDTISSHKLNGGYKITRFIVLLSGYSFPILMGAVIMGSVFYEQYLVGLWITLIISFLSIIFIRNFFGFIIVFIFAALAALPYFFLPEYFFYILGTLGALAFTGGIKDIFVITKAVYTGRVTDGSDFSLMRDELFIPQRVGVVLEWLYVIALISGVVFGFNYLLNAFQ